MAAVSKPGGLTTSAVLARRAAMAVVNPIPGQESRNRDFLVENGAAIKINNLATLTLKLELLPRDPLFFDHHAESDVIDALPGRESQAEGRG